MAVPPASRRCISTHALRGSRSTSQTGVVARDILSRHQPLTFSQRDLHRATLLDNRYLALPGQPAHAHKEKLVGELRALPELAQGRLAVLVQILPDHPRGVSNLSFHLPLLNAEHLSRRAPWIEPNRSGNVGRCAGQRQLGVVPRSIACSVSASHRTRRAGTA